jgi:iron complex outermembrane receptor protein
MGHDAFLADSFAELRWGRIHSRFEVFNLLDAEYYDGEFVYASRFGETANLVPARHVSVGAPRTWFWSLAVST